MPITNNPLGNLWKLPTPFKPQQNQSIDPTKQIYTSTPQTSQPQIDTSSVQLPSFGWWFWWLRALMKNGDIDREIEQMWQIARQQKQEKMATDQLQEQTNQEKEQLKLQLQDVWFDVTELEQIKNNKAITPTQIEQYSNILWIDKNELENWLKTSWFLVQTTTWWWIKWLLSDASEWSTLDTLINPIWAWVSAIDRMVQSIPTSNSWDWTLNWIKDFAVNAIPSVLKLATSTASAITNPYDTVSWITELVWSEDWRKALWNFFVDKYWSLDWFQNYAKTDPAGIVSDLLTIVSAGAGAWVKAASLTGKVWKVWKLSKIAKIADTISSAWMNKAIPAWLNKLTDATKWLPVLWKATDLAVKATSPLKTATDIYNKSNILEKWKQIFTRNIPVKNIENDLKLTPKERARVEQTGISAGEFMAEKKLWWLSKEDQITSLAKIADDNYWKVTEAIKNIPSKIKLESENAKKMLQTMSEEMRKSKIIEREMPEYLQKLDELSQQKDYTPKELLDIKRDFDRIVGKKIFDSQWRVDWTEDDIIAWRRREVWDQIENVAKENWIDIWSMNKDLRNAITIRNWLLRSNSQWKKNNTISIQDIGIGAILWQDPVTATAVILWKKSLDKAIPIISQWLYNLNKEKNVPTNMSRGNPITPRDTTRGFSITTDNNGSKSNAPRLGLPYKPQQPTIIAPWGKPQVKAPIIPTPLTKNIIEKRNPSIETWKPNNLRNLDIENIKKENKIKSDKQKSIEDQKKQEFETNKKRLEKLTRDYDKLPVNESIPSRNYKDTYTTNKWDIQSVSMDRWREIFEIWWQKYRRSEIDIYKKKESVIDLIKNLDKESLSSKKDTINTDKRKSISEFWDRKWLNTSNLLDDIWIKQSDIKPEDMSEFLDLVNARKFWSSYEKKYNAFKEKYSKDQLANKQLEPLYKEARKYKSAEEFIDSKLEKQSYRSAHQLKLSDSYTADKIDVSKLKEQIRARRGYLNNDTIKWLKKLEKLQWNPDMEITIYRASPKEWLNDGDWITTDKIYANDIKKQNWWKVYSYKAKVSDLRFPIDVETLPSVAMESTFSYSPKTSQLKQIREEANKTNNK